MTASVPALANNVIWNESAEGIVVVDPTAGKVRVFNGVASTVWKLVSKNESISAIRDAIVAQYDVSAEKAESDIIGFLTSLKTLGLIQWNPQIT